MTSKRKEILILVAICVVSAAIRLHVYFTTTPSSIGRVGVTASHTDIALSIVRNEEFSFNVARHLWIEEHLDSLVDVPIENPPAFESSERTEITYMDPGYSVMVGLISRLTHSSIHWRYIQLVQIFLDLLLSLILYSLGRQLGLSVTVSAIAPALHAVNIFLLRSVFELVQDYSVLFLVVVSVWLMLVSNSRKFARWLTWGGLFVVGGILPWFRSLFVLYPFAVFLLAATLLLLKKGSRPMLLLAAIFLVGSLALYVVPRNLQFSRAGLPFSFGRPGCFWYTFYCGQHQFDDGPIGDELARPTMFKLDSTLRDRPLLTSWNRIDSLFKGVVLADIRQSPSHYAQQCAERLVVGFFPAFYGNFNNRLTIPSAILYLGRGALFLLSGWIILFFIYYFIKGKETKSLFLLAPWIYVVFVSAPFYLQGRSLMPGIDLMMVFFMFSLAFARERFGTRFSRPTPP